MWRMSLIGERAFLCLQRAFGFKCIGIKSSVLEGWRIPPRFYLCLPLLPSETSMTLISIVADDHVITCCRPFIPKYLELPLFSTYSLSFPDLAPFWGKILVFKRVGTERRGPKKNSGSRAHHNYVMLQIRSEKNKIFWKASIIPCSWRPPL